MSLPLPLGQRVLDLDPETPGFAVWCHEVCVKKVIFCVKKKIECERNSLIDPDFWHELVLRGYVLRVRDK